MACGSTAVFLGTVNRRIRGWSAAAISSSGRSARLTGHSMFDWPEQIQTSPTRMSLTSTDFGPATVRVCGPPGGIGAEPGHPLALGVGRGLDRLAGQRDLDPLAGLGPAPDRDRDVALEDDVVGEQRVEERPGLALVGPRPGEQGEGECHRSDHGAVVLSGGVATAPGLSRSRREPSVTIRIDRARRPAATAWRDSRRRPVSAAVHSGSRVWRKQAARTREADRAQPRGQVDRRPG